MTKPTGRPRGRPKTEWYSTLMARVPDELGERVKRYAAQKQPALVGAIRDALELLIEDDRYHPFMYDSKADTPFLSDRNGETAVSLTPPILSDTKGEPGSPAPQEPAIMSDTKEEYDTTRYYLGALCDKDHDCHGSGQTLRRRSDHHCLECRRERKRNARTKQRQRSGDAAAPVR